MLLPASFPADRSSKIAFERWKETVSTLIALHAARDVLEIGGGRSPSFKEEEARALDIRYTSNDISQRELDKAPEWVGKAHFDISARDPGAVAPFADSFDFAFSKMVMEHVSSFERSYRNIYTVLKPGGIAIAFHPTLFALPFVANKLLPETASRRLLTAFFPERSDVGRPKFPAHYSGCFASNRIRDRLRAIGFREVEQIAFYGHNYYRALPGIRQLHAAITKRLAQRDFQPLASFAYTVVQK